MKLLAKPEELTTAALRARLAGCESMLACSGLRRQDRAKLERQRRCVSAVLAQRESETTTLVSVVTMENCRLGHAWLRRKLREQIATHGVVR